jgi:hypothetical protein
VPRVRVITADYLNPEDIMQANHLIFVSDAIEKAVELFSQEVITEESAPKTTPKAEGKTPADTKPAAAKKAPVKTTTKKADTKPAATSTSTSTK